MTRKEVFRDESKLLIQHALKEAIVQAIATTEGAELDDVCYVLTEQLTFWQLRLFERLNAPEVVHAP